MHSTQSKPPPVASAQSPSSDWFQLKCWFQANQAKAIFKLFLIVSFVFSIPPSFAFENTLSTDVNIYNTTLYQGPEGGANLATNAIQMAGAATATGNYSIAIGSNSGALAQGSVVIAENSSTTATATNSVIIGSKNKTVTGSNVGVFGWNSANLITVSGNNSLIIGNGTISHFTASNAFSLGGANNSFGSSATGSGAIGGQYHNVSQAYSVAVGGGVLTTGRSHQAVFGNRPFSGETSAYMVLGYNFETIFRVQSNGNVYAKGGVESTSDARLKKEIRPFEYGLKELLALNPVHFKWKRDDRDDVGLIAQEVYQLVPELVQKGAGDESLEWNEVAHKNAIWTMSYDKLSLVLINTVKEQQAMIAALEQQNQDLTAGIVALERLANQANQANQADPTNQSQNQ